MGETESHRTYLGDSVYAEVDRGYIKLTTNNGYPDDPRNVIMLEPCVYATLEEWISNLRQAYSVSAAADQDPEN